MNTDEKRLAKIKKRIATTASGVAETDEDVLLRLLDASQARLAEEHEHFLQAVADGLAVSKKCLALAVAVDEIEASMQDHDTSDLGERAAEAFNSGNAHRDMSGRLRDYTAVLVKHMREALSPAASRSLPAKPPS